MYWHERHPQRWAIERQVGAQLLDSFVGYIGDRGLAALEGIYHIRSEHGIRYESVDLRIEYPESFLRPGVVPTVRLMSHRKQWQNVADAHIYPDWSLCLFVPGESGIDFQNDNSLEHLFGVIQTYLFKQYVFQKALIRQQLTGQLARWPGPARSHGFAGVAEAVRNSRYGRNHACPCGSGQKYKHCCMRRIQQLENRRRR